MGHRRLHESAGVWTIYHALDSEVADPFQAYQATRYVDTEIPHIPGSWRRIERRRICNGFDHELVALFMEY